MISVSPKLGEFLTKLTQTPDLETAFWQIFNEYVTMKTAALREANNVYGRKWGMTFDEFTRRCQDGTLNQDAYSGMLSRIFGDGSRRSLYYAITNHWLCNGCRHVCLGTNERFILN